MEKLQPGSPSQEKPPPRSPQKRRLRNLPAAPESDKDSGYSDVGSECLSGVEQTDTEECQPLPHWSAAGKPPRGRPPPPPPPLLLLKNLLGDEGSRPDPHAPSWAVRPSFQLLPSSSQILVLPPSVPPVQPGCHKSTNYWPILNSYTKIAPHPSQLSSRVPHSIAHKRGAETWHHPRAKRLPAGLQGKAPAAHEGNVPESLVLSHAVSGCSLTTPANTPDTGATTDWGEPVLPPHTAPHTAHQVLPVQQNKSRRFHNTLDILRRSGLLTIAMKTKELARLNQATQVQLERLQEQVGLYTTAMCSNRPEDWQMLQEALTLREMRDL
ncbi:CLOCK-interacting pacemaker [Dendropsophus ebraccatus]|uniref:CLOCK-interacting pacemaker n=1 Tax=Dendropsophus ebraccatus TaxID=150705 RepID=UPI0038315AD3